MDIDIAVTVAVQDVVVVLVPLRFRLSLTVILESMFDISFLHHLSH